MIRAPFILILFFGVKGFSLYAQGTAFEVGYKYNSKNYIQLGLSHRFNLSKDLYNPLNVNVSLLTDFKNCLPLIGFQKRWGESYEIGLNTTNRYVEPIVGVNLFNLAKAHLGYSISYGSNTFPNNLTFGLLINIGESNYHDRLKLF